jgi:hypothetical protein
MPTDDAQDTEAWPCWFHGEEPIPSNVYRRCFECGHVWTKRTLKRAYRKALWELSKGDPLFLGDGFRSSRVRTWWRLATVRASTIYFCQECIHDW